MLKVVEMKEMTLLNNFREILFCDAVYFSVRIAKPIDEKILSQSHSPQRYG